MSFDWSFIIDALTAWLGQFPALQQLVEYLSDPKVLNAVGLAIKIIGIAAIWVGLVSVALAVLTYIFRSLSLFTVAKRRGCKLYGMAWIPVLWNWVLGSLADKKDDEDAAEGSAVTKRSWRHVLLWLSVLSLIVSMLTGTGNAIKAIALAIAGQGGFELVIRVILACLSFVGVSKSLGSLIRILRYICYLKLFESSTKHPILLTVLSILFPITLPFILFFTRNLEKGVKVNPEGEATTAAPCDAPETLAE